AARFGATALICVGLTKSTYAGCPPTVTLTVSSVVGNLPSTILLLQSFVTGERLVPVMVNHAFAAIPGWKLAPFTTALIEGPRLVTTWPTGRDSAGLFTPPAESTTFWFPAATEGTCMFT